MEIKKAKALITAILFAAADPISLEKIALNLQLDKKTTKNILEVLITEFDKEESGICILKMGNLFQMCAKAKYATEIRKVLELRRNTPLSEASMEALAVIAYNQPVTKAFIETVRGVDCSGPVSSLVNKGLIEEKGRLELPGRPLLYGTSANFLKCFGISSIDELTRN